MAVDTAVRRSSALSFSTTQLPIPDATVGAGDRQTLLSLYSGILSGATVSVGTGLTKQYTEMLFLINQSVPRKHLNKMELEWLQSQGVTAPTLDGAWHEFLTNQGFSVGALPDRKMNWLIDQGHDLGSLDANFLSYWQA